ncbi:hypothetical protein MSAN_02113500 [Mycena sanguinolenta]|uniref:Uncharacterized protein n=1 Tax=Mycena sanguinolenta TaxID=230812 RepID=A0A8H7CLV5_9AGAR|nr:hypothetical protein MSAN_02113500 [Mycena sanguinolenta]
MEFLPPPPGDVIDIPGDAHDQDVQVTKQLPGTSTAEKNALSDFESDDEDEEEDDDEEEVKPLIAPSTDIKADFEAALEDGFDFDGVFAFSERYGMGVAPNPCLKINGLGTVGIPLSDRDARAIISASKPVCVFNNDPKTSGRWELAPEKVHFENPAWTTWVQNTAGVAASTALAAYASVKPSFTLKKLIIHEKNTLTTRHKEPTNLDESNRKIGDFIVILPGRFEGAQLQLSHAGQVKKLNFAHQSGLSTSVVAAYSGVEHTLAGVASGYRLSLVYDIVQPMTHIGYRPTLPEMQGATQKLQHILRSWKQMDPEEAPEMLACLLQHKYPKTQNFNAKSLTGSDAHLVSHLHPLARELKFRIYLAHVRVTVTTPSEAEDHDEYGYGGCGYGRRRFGRWGGYDDYYDEYDEEDIDEGEFVDDEDNREESLRVTQVVDLRGMPVSVHLDLESDDLLNGSITDQDPDQEKFERLERTSAQRIQFYHRTVLLIWPKDGDMDSGVSVGDIYDYACHALRSSLTVSPTDKEKKLIARLLQCCQTHRNEAKLKSTVQVLRESADRWNEPQVLLQTLKACGVDKNTDLMGPESFVSAYQAFGWEVLKDFFEQAMANDESNARRHALLARLTQMGAEEEDAEVSLWCRDQADRALRSLSKIDATQIPWLVDLGLSRGGEFLRDVIFPQLRAQTLDKTFWIPFLQRIQLSINTIPTTSPEVVNSLILQCVTETVRNLSAFPTKTLTSSYSYISAREDKSSDAILEVIKFCVETRNEPLCGEIFNKMRDGARRGVYSPSFPPWLYYAELSPSLIHYTQGKPALDAVLQPFFVDVVDSMISAARQSPLGKAITPCPLTDAHKSIMVNAARKVGGITILKERLTAATLKGHDSSTIQALVLTIVREFPRQQLQGGVQQQAYNDLIIALVRLAIDTFDTSSLSKPTYPYYNANPADKMIGMIKFCFAVGAKNQCQRLLLRFVPPPNGSTVGQHVSKVLAPFMSVLRQYLLSKRLDFQTEPYKMFAAAVVKAFAEQVMVQKPTEVVPAAQRQAAGCQGCAECRELRAFFVSDAPTIRFSRVQGIRTHLERELQKIRYWGVKWETIRSGSPHTLLVTKPPSMTAVGLWTANSKAGKALLQDLGDVATQARILGPAYPTVYARIHGEVAAAGPVPLANANQILNAPKRVATCVPAAPSVPKKPRLS